MDETFSYPSTQSLRTVCGLQPQTAEGGWEDGGGCGDVFSLSRYVVACGSVLL